MTTQSFSKGSFFDTDMRVYVDSAPEKRHERHLMRQRGAGARALAPTSGFMINVTKRTVPLATGSKTPSRTPMRKRLSMVARTPSKTPIRTPSRALSKTPATARISARKALEPIQSNVEPTQGPEHDVLLAKTPVKTSTKTPAETISKTPCRTPFIYKRKMPRTVTETTRGVSPASAELVDESKVVALNSRDTSVNTKDLQSLSITKDALPAAQHEELDAMAEEMESIIVHEPAALVEPPIVMEEVQTEAATAQDCSIPLDEELDGEQSGSEETVKKSTPIKKTAAQRKTNRRKRKPVTMPKPKRKVVAKAKVGVVHVKEQAEDGPAGKQIEKSHASSRGLEITKDSKASKEAESRKQPPLVAAERVNQLNKRKAVEGWRTAEQPVKRKKAGYNAEELPVESTIFRQPSGRKTSEPALAQSPAPKAEPARHHGLNSNEIADSERVSTPEEADTMHMGRHISGADARTARIRAGRRRMWRDGSSSKSTTDADMEYVHRVVSPAMSILSPRNSNTLAPSPVRVRQPFEKQKILISTTQRNRADKENSRSIRDYPDQ